jgi:hypothetical protein
MPPLQPLRSSHRATTNCSHRTTRYRCRTMSTASRRGLATSAGRPLRRPRWHQHCLRPGQRADRSIRNPIHHHIANYDSRLLEYCSSSTKNRPCRSPLICCGPHISLRSEASAPRVAVPSTTPKIFEVASTLTCRMTSKNVSRCSADKVFNIESARFQYGSDAASTVVVENKSR